MFSLLLFIFFYYEPDTPYTPQRWKAREEGVRVGGGARAEELWLSNTAVAAEEAEAEAEGRWPRFK